MIAAVTMISTRMSFAPISHCAVARVGAALGAVHASQLDLFSRAVEPTLQRELKHKGAADGDGSYSAELIGYIEILPG